MRKIQPEIQFITTYAKRKEYPEPPAELRALLRYDSNGDLTWAKAAGSVAPGSQAGCTPPAGVRRVRYHNELYPVDLLAWWVVTGDWTGNMDRFYCRHGWVDGDITNNRADNLQREYRRRDRYEGRYVCETLDEFALMIPDPLVPEDYPERAGHPSGSVRQGDLLKWLVLRMVGRRRWLADEAYLAYKAEHTNAGRGHWMRTLRSLKRKGLVVLEGDWIATAESTATAAQIMMPEKAEVVLEDEWDGGAPEDMVPDWMT